MKLKWYGHAAFRLNPGEPAVLDALEFSLNGGDGQVAGLAASAIEAVGRDQHPEHEVPGRSGMYRFDLDGIRVAHMGDVGSPLGNSQVAFFESVDFAFANKVELAVQDMPDTTRVLVMEYER